MIQTNRNKTIFIEDCDPRMDAIDDTCSELLEKAFDYLDLKLPDGYEDFDDLGYSIGAIPELREKVIEIIESLGYEFKYKNNE